MAVLMVNLGTPDAASAKAVKTYLREFLSDRRVVDYPRLFWMPVLHGIILNTRPAKTAKLYESVWYEERGESPLLAHTRDQAEALAARFEADGVRVAFAMRYGNPAIAARLEALKAEGHDRILILPLYPQYSSTTTATVVDETARTLARMMWQPAIRTAPAFHDDPDYITALASSMRSHVPRTAERVILSFHGLPERYLHAGDPYHCHCQKTARLLREEMGWSESFAPLAFQSKFGPEKWLGPATADLVDQAAKDGIGSLAIAAPAFVADCLETLEEVGIGLKESFLERGGAEFTMIPCLNDDTAFIDALEVLIRREMAGWIGTGTR